jgi:hypothetical protein
VQKPNCKTLFILSLLLGKTLYAQIPSLNWAKQLGGPEVDVPFVIKFTADGGTIAAGYTTSKDGACKKL